MLDEDELFFDSFEQQSRDPMARALLIVCLKCVVAVLSTAHSKAEHNAERKLKASTFA